MGLIKVKFPLLRTSVDDYGPCLVSIYIDAKFIWCARCDRIAVFKAQETCQVAFLIYDLDYGRGLPYAQDLVITGILSPGKQYEMQYNGDSFEFVETVLA